MPASFDEPRAVTFDAAKVFDVGSQALIRTSRSLEEARVAVQYLSHPGIVVLSAAAWPDSRVQFTDVLPIEITVDNGSTEDLRIHHRHVVLVMNSGRHISAFPPAALLQTLDSEIDGEVRLPIDQMRERALAEGTLPRDRRRTGFLYFQNPADAEQLDLKINLTSVESGNQFGTVIIPFVVD